MEFTKKIKQIRKTLTDVENDFHFSSLQMEIVIKILEKINDLRVNPDNIDELRKEYAKGLLFADKALEVLNFPELMGIIVKELNIQTKATFGD